LLNYSGRLFTFGCSFTNYDWPTWADILGRKFSYYENWGNAGGGNQYIFNSVIEANLRNKFTADDTIIIMWTSVTRNDSYSKGNWIFDPDHMGDTADYRGLLIRDLASITAISNLLESLGVCYEFLSMLPLTLSPNFDLSTSNFELTEFNDEVTDVIALYSETVDKIKPSYYELVAKFDWFSGQGLTLDYLPTDLELTRLVKDTVDLPGEYYKFVGTNFPSFEEYYFNNYDHYPDFVKKEIKKFDKIKKSIYDQNKKELLKLIDYRTGLVLKKLKKYPRDPHPTPSEHLRYLEMVFPKLHVDSETRYWVSEYNTKVLSYEIVSIWQQWQSQIPKIRL